MFIARTVEEVRAYVEGGPGGVVIVPTMGALHDGHGRLIERACEEADRRWGDPSRVVVSVFVNPTQFDESADYDRYPRVVESDAAQAAALGAGCVFAPSVEEVYPADGSAGVPPLPDVAFKPILEDAAREGHFAGVCQVVARLFVLVRPEVAIFGAKDWQQGRVVTALSRWLAEQPGGPSVEIVVEPTVREPDGLAMSSRNRFLSEAEREAALSIRRALTRALEGSTPAEAESLMRQELARAGIGGLTPRRARWSVDYAACVDAETLLPPVGGVGDVAMRCLIGVRLGATRLLDNDAWEPVRVSGGVGGAGGYDGDQDGGGSVGKDAVLQKSPLQQFHADHGAQMTEFAGWEMPLQYRGRSKSTSRFGRVAGSSTCRTWGGCGCRVVTRVVCLSVCVRVGSRRWRRGNAVIR